MTAVKLDEPLSILVLPGLTLPEVSEGDLAKIRAAALGVCGAGIGTTTALSISSLTYLVTATRRAWRRLSGPATGSEYVKQVGSPS